MLISEVQENQKQPANPAPNRPHGRVRHPFVAWAIASLRIMWSAVRHPGQPVLIDYQTGDVWLAHSYAETRRNESA